MPTPVKLIQEKSPEQALQSLMTLCAKAERSSGDARRLMARWRVEASRREDVLQKLIADKFIDDARYAVAYMREKSRLNGWGAHKIRAMLVRKGIAKDVIDEAVGQIDPEKSQDKLLELLHRKARTLPADEPRKLRDKLMRYGLGRGFGYEQVADCLHTILKNDEE